jgi:hypothetical protein
MTVAQSHLAANGANVSLVQSPMCTDSYHGKSHLYSWPRIQVHACKGARSTLARSISS